MYLRAKYTKYKMAKTKFSIWRYIICEICKKNGSNRPFLASRVADTIFPPPIEGYHRQLDNQCKDPMDNNKDCRVGQLTTYIPTHKWPPKSVRPELARCISSLWQRIAASPADEKLWAMESIFFRCIIPAGQGAVQLQGDQWSHIKAIKERLTRWQDGKCGELWAEAVAGQ